eukprot:Skav202848  [mRNA]  locus=scaffold2311:41860:54177:+ [translate_table: standard]
MQSFDTEKSQHVEFTAAVHFFSEPLLRLACRHVKVVRKPKKGGDAARPGFAEAETAADAAKPLIRRQEARRKAKAKAGKELIPEEHLRQSVAFRSVRRTGTVSGYDSATGRYQARRPPMDMMRGCLSGYVIFGQSQQASP